MTDVKELTPIGLADLRELIKLYRRDWPKYCAEYYCLKCFIRLLEDEPEIKNLKMFTIELKEEKEPHGLFIIIDRYQLFLGGLENCQGPLMTQALRLLNWSNGLKCSSIPDRHYPSLQNIIKEFDLSLEFDDDSLLYFMSASEASKLQFEIPSGYAIRSLSEADAKMIDEHWPNQHLGSLFFIQRQIRRAINVGLYEEQTQQLVAWCIRLQGGYMGALQVKETHRRRGFGLIVTQAMAKRMAEIGDDAIALVNPENTPSYTMFEKLGFKNIDNCHWLRTEPIAGDVYWPDGE